MPVTDRRRTHIRPAAALVAGMAALALAASAAPGALAVPVPSSIARDCSQDVTAPLVRWLSALPDGATAAFAPGACHRVDGTLELRGGGRLVLEGRGATFRASAPPADQRAVWRLVDKRPVTFRDMRIVGSYAAGGVHAPSLEHSHAIDVRGTRVLIERVRMSDVGGDCVYLGMGYTAAYVRASGVVRNSRCTGTGRSAVAVTAADDVLVERMTTDRIGLSAFNVEPNIGPGWGARRVAFRRNVIGSYRLYAFALVENGPIADQTFAGNRIRGTGLRIGIVDPGGRGFRPRRVTIVGNRSGTPQTPAAMELWNVDGALVRGNTVRMTSGVMASAENSCAVVISGNRFPGGTSQGLVNRSPAGCESRCPARAGAGGRAPGPCNRAAVPPRLPGATTAR